MYTKEQFFLQNLHTKTKRNYLERMNLSKPLCMKIASQYGEEYWDGNRKYGYGGYKFIEGRWSKVAKKIVKKFKLKDGSKILDIGCGKGYLMYELIKLNPKFEVCGFDFSKYAIKNSHPAVKNKIKYLDLAKKFSFKNKSKFDLIISLGTIYNLRNFELEYVLRKINTESKQSYLVVESYKNFKELFNLQCWALTCKTFLSKEEWIWLFKKYSPKSLYEFMYFE